MRDEGVHAATVADSLRTTRRLFREGAHASTWRCGECTELNTADCLACLLCGAPKPDPQSREAGLGSSLDHQDPHSSGSSRGGPKEADGGASLPHTSLDSPADMEALYGDVEADATPPRTSSPGPLVAEATASRDGPAASSRNTTEDQEPGDEPTVGEDRGKPAPPTADSGRGWEKGTPAVRARHGRGHAYDATNRHRPPRRRDRAKPGNGDDTEPAAGTGDEGASSRPPPRERLSPEDREALLAELAKPADFTDTNGRRWVRWLCHSCPTVNTHLFGHVGRCRSCHKPFTGVRPWVCQKCGEKNPRQRTTCLSCDTPRVTGLSCKKCSTPHGLFDRWCPGCKTWGAGRHGFKERLIARTFACPSCGATVDADSNNTPRVSGYCDGETHACHACGATFNYRHHMRRTEELPLLPTRKGLSAKTRDADDPGRLYPKPPGDGTTRFTSREIESGTAAPDASSKGAAAAAPGPPSTGGAPPEQMREPATMTPTPARVPRTVVPKNPWDCALCGHTNEPGATSCSQCFEPRPDEDAATSNDRASSRRGGVRQKSPSWRCQICRTLNPASCSVCVACGKGTCPDVTPAMRRVRGDWKCPTCTFVNFSSRIACRRCSTPRPDAPTETDSSGGATAAANAGASWRCVICQHANLNRSSTTCAVCGTDALNVRAAKGSPKVHTLHGLTGDAAAVAASRPAKASGGGLGAAVDRKPKSWTCPVCEQRNDAASPTCTLCDASKPSVPEDSAADVGEDGATTVSTDGDGSVPPDQQTFRCPFCSAPRRAGSPGAPLVTNGGSAMTDDVPNCDNCGRHPREAVAGVWFCGNPRCDERSSAELQAPEERADGAKLLPVLGTWNSVTRVVCSRCNTPRDPATMPLYQYLSRCSACSSDIPGSSVTAACPQCGHSPVRRLGDYTCSVCGADNFANRHYCRSCHRQRSPRYAFLDSDGLRIRNSGLPEDDAWALASLRQPRDHTILPPPPALPSSATSGSTHPSEHAASDDGGADASAAAGAAGLDSDGDNVTGIPAFEEGDGGHGPMGADGDEADNSAPAKNTGHSSSGATWTCRLCGEVNTTVDSACAGCGVDR